MTTVAPHPLQWPIGRSRTPRSHRKNGRFTEQSSAAAYTRMVPISIATALSRLDDEVTKIGAKLAVLSSNLDLRLDGRPRSGQRDPEDPGVALYYQLNGRPYCLPCDTYHGAGDNIAAIAAHIEATRAIERYGVATLAEMFSGFAALPPPASKREWWRVLEVPRDATTVDVEAAHRSLIRQFHPDGGRTPDAERAAEINAARDEALKALGQ